MSQVCSDCKRIVIVLFDGRCSECDRQHAFQQYRREHGDIPLVELFDAKQLHRLDFYRWLVAEGRLVS